MMAARDFDVDNTRCLLEAGVSKEILYDTIGRVQMMSGGMVQEGESFEGSMERKQQTRELLMQHAS